MMPHVYVRYYTGTGDVYYIDPVYQLLWGGKKDLPGAIRVEKYKEDEIDQQLSKKYFLYNPTQERGDLSLTNVTQQGVDGYLEASTGNLVDMVSEEFDRPQWWVDKVVAIVKKVQPGWSKER